VDKARIEQISGRKILDSRGKETIEVVINWNSTGSAPAGASVGVHEAVAIPADAAVRIANTKLQELKGIELDQLAVDIRLKQIDGTANFSKIGGNTATAVSYAVYNALHPETKGRIFPRLLTNVFGGGRHGGKTSIQEFLVCPLKAKSFPEAVSLVKEAQARLRDELIRRFGWAGTNDEGALVADMNDTKALELVKSAAADLKLGVGLDLAASTFFNPNTNTYDWGAIDKRISQTNQVDFVLDLIKTFRLFYVEDPLREEDFAGFAELQKKARKCLISGDDLTVTDSDRIKFAAKNKAIRAVIIKPNQIGTVSQTKDAVEAARKNKILPVISHRSAETNDVTIAKLALDWQLPLAKLGFSDMSTKISELMRAWQSAERPKLAGLKI